jgi:hypothetical protein
MTINGHVENGKIVLDESVPLTEGMKVRIELLQAAPPQNGETDNTSEPSELTFYERHKSWLGSISDLPPDYAKNIDHYLYGTPKK